MADGRFEWYCHGYFKGCDERRFQMNGGSVGGSNAQLVVSKFVNRQGKEREQFMSKER